MTNRNIGNSLKLRTTPARRKRACSRRLSRLGRGLRGEKERAHRRVEFVIVQLKHAWQLGKQLYQGGFGIIFEGTPVGNDEPVVIKLVPKIPGASRELLFEELSGAANLVPIIDTGEYQNKYALVMPRAEKSLRQHLDAVGKITEREALAVLLDTAKGLCSLKGRVVHRDLKPENILYLNGSWCITDFGIARYANAATSPDTRKYSMTPAYAAPEKWNNERATEETDVYSWGVVAYEILTGERPFKGPTREEFAEQHLNDEPPSLQGVSPYLAALILQCLLKAPGARPSIEEVVERLQRGLDTVRSGLESLQRANLRVVEKRSQLDAAESVRRLEITRKQDLVRSASEIISPILDELRTIIETNAPAALFDRGQWPCTLGQARLRIAPIRASSASGGRRPPVFDVVSYTSIEVTTSNPGYRGRSHSLWFCDALEEGKYRWYETAFMFSPLTRSSSLTEPFALDPGEEAWGALGHGMDLHQVAWPFEPVNREGQDSFLRQWISWFAEAAEGRLQHPRSMPEKTVGGWRITRGT